VRTLLAGVVPTCLKKYSKTQIHQSFSDRVIDKIILSFFRCRRISAAGFQKRTILSDICLY
jgi:hypothetical protein